MKVKYVVLVIVLLSLILSSCSLTTPEKGAEEKPAERDDFGCWPPLCSIIPDPQGKQMCEDWKAGKQVTWPDCSFFASTYPKCQKLCEFEKKNNPSTVPASPTPVYNNSAGNQNFSISSSLPSESQMDCSIFASVPDCSVVGKHESQSYKFCKQCLPDKAGSSSPDKDPDPENVDIYIGDFKHGRIIKIEDMVGTGWTAFGSQGTGVGQFELPEHLAVDDNGRIYIPNADNGNVIRMDDMTGKGWVLFAGLGIRNTLKGQQPGPFVVRVRGEQIYTAGWGHVYRFDDMSGKNLVTYGEAGKGIGKFDSPQYLSFDTQGRFYIGDNNNHRIVRMDDMTGKGWIEFGSLGKGVGQFNTTACVTVDQQGRIYVCDEHNDRIVRIDDMTGKGWTTFLSTGVTGQSLSLLHDIAIGPTGKIYIADTGNNRIVRIDDMTGKGWIAYEPYANAPPGSDVHQMEAPKGIFVVEKKK